MYDWMPWNFPDVFIAKPLTNSTVSWKDDLELRRLFGLALAKARNPFEAGCQVFPEDSSAALFVSINWINDPAVIAAKVDDSETVGIQAAKLLDKNELAAKLLSFADEKISVNGNILYAAEAKDRLAALKLFAEVQGFIGKVDLNQTNNYVNNAMKIVLVEAKQEEKVVEHQVEQSNLPALPIKLKLVG